MKTGSAFLTDICNVYVTEKYYRLSGVRNLVLPDGLSRWRILDYHLCLPGVLVVGRFAYLRNKYTFLGQNCDRLYLQTILKYWCFLFQSWNGYSNIGATRRQEPICQYVHPHLCSHRHVHRFPILKLWVFKLMINVIHRKRCQERLNLLSSDNVTSEVGSAFHENSVNYTHRVTLSCRWVWKKLHDD